MHASEHQLDCARGVATNVLVTGGAGYVGSAVATALERIGLIPIIVDDLRNGRATTTRGRRFYRGDVGDRDVLDQVFTDQRISAVVHCAALTGLAESFAHADEVHRCNVTATLELLAAMSRHDCAKLVLSSSAAVYQQHPAGVAVETGPLSSQSPYGSSKIDAERLILNWTRTAGVRAICLRYFNIVGANRAESEAAGWGPAPATVLPRLVDAAFSGAPFTLNGDRWPTRDGTAVRDFVHVADVAAATVAAVAQFDTSPWAQPRFEAINVGTGRGTTLRELIRQVESVTGQKIAVAVGRGRAGDSAGMVASTAKAEMLLQWRVQRSLVSSIRDAC